MLTKHLGLVEGAGLLETFVTAHSNLFIFADALQDEKVLIHGGAGGLEQLRWGSAGRWV